MIVNKNYPLKNITTIGLGGHCREYVCPSDQDDLKNVMKKNPLYIGNGSNICFATDYFDGTIVSLKKWINLSVMMRNIFHVLAIFHVLS